VADPALDCRRRPEHHRRVRAVRRRRSGSEDRPVVSRRRPRRGLDHRAASDAFETFVATAAGCLATLLALFFTTLGVAAAATYTNVSNEVRSLFLRERENTASVNTVVLAVMFGLLLLVAHTIGYRPYTATVIAF